MKLFWTRLALIDRASLFDLHDKHTAIELDVIIEEKTLALQDDPYCGRPFFLEGIYRLDIWLGYAFAYDLKGKVIRILRVLDTN